MAQDTQLRGLAEAALEFGKAWEGGQHEHRVPQRTASSSLGMREITGPKGHPIGAQT